MAMPANSPAKPSNYGWHALIQQTVEFGRAPEVVAGFGGSRKRIVDPAMAGGVMQQDESKGDIVDRA